MDRGTIESKSHTVLIAEDDEDLLGTYEVWLAGCDDISVVTALDGESALAAVDGGVDVLVLDRKLPALSGPEVLERLADDRVDLDVVVVSAYKPDGYIREEDVAAYLVKPVGREAFVETIRRTFQ